MAVRLFFAVAFIILVLGLSGTRSSIAQATEGQSTQSTAQGTAPSQQPAMQDMMKMYEQMMADMTAGNAKLDALVEEMNGATGDAKINAVAAVVTELVRQQKAMRGRMGQMHHHMMGMGGPMMHR